MLFCIQSRSTKIFDWRYAEAGIRVGLIQGGSNWSMHSNPAAATAASVTRPAGNNGMRNVLDTLAATLATGATAQATAIGVVVRDGAAGVGTILWQKQVILNTNAVWDISLNLTGLGILGSPNTAMTVEFNAAPVAGAFSSVAATGHAES